MSLVGSHGCHVGLKRLTECSFGLLNGKKSGRMSRGHHLPRQSLDGWDRSPSGHQSRV